jgi:hypothetical protein
VIDSVRHERRADGIRLTRRGRVVLTVLVAMILVWGFWLTAKRGAGASSGPGDRPGAAGRGSGLGSVKVGRHDTLWGIASRHRPGADPRTTVQRIIDLNGLSGVIVQPGQELRLPTR